MQSCETLLNFDALILYSTEPTSSRVNSNSWSGVEPVSSNVILGLFLYLKPKPPRTYLSFSVHCIINRGINRCCYDIIQYSISLWYLLVVYQTAWVYVPICLYAYYYTHNFIHLGWLPSSPPINRIPRNFTVPVNLNAHG